MASIISVDKIRSTGGTANIIDIDSSADTNAITIDSSGNVDDITMNGEGGTNTTSLVEGLMKVRAFTNSTGTTINQSINVSSLTDQATGQQVINFTNNLEDGNHSPQASHDSAGGNHIAIAGNTSSKFVTYAFSTAYTDLPIRSTVHGGLA
jgi:hypothetical protein